MTVPARFPASERIRDHVAELADARASVHPSEAAHAALLQLRIDFRRVMDHTEDIEPEIFDQAHSLLDEVGALLRRHYPQSCRLPYGENDSFLRECPVDLAHIRAGPSPEYLILASECSICKADPEDCDHVPGREYDGEMCLSVITDMEFTATAVVARPRWREARFTTLGIPRAILEHELGSPIGAGSSAICNKCLSPCVGLNRSFEGATHG